MYKLSSYAVSLDSDLWSFTIPDFCTEFFNRDACGLPSIAASLGLTKRVGSGIIVSGLKFFRLRAGLARPKHHIIKDFFLKYTKRLCIDQSTLFYDLVGSI